MIVKKSVTEDKSASIPFQPALFAHSGNDSNKSFYARVITELRQARSEYEELSVLNRLAEQYGQQMCQAIFQVLADLRLEEAEAVTSWHNVYQHTNWLSKRLGHQVSPVTAMCDYLCYQKQSYDKPKLTTIDSFESLTNNSTFDRLTGLLNRNCFRDTLAHLLALTEREGTELSLAFFDIDDFKDVNDSYGHHIGDLVLQGIGQLISTSIRQSDIALRFGGEELVVLMPNTNCSDALLLSNRIRENVEKHRFVEDGSSIKVTISGGIAVYPLNAKTAEELVNFADHALYRAKGSGKNNVMLFKDENRHSHRVKLYKQVQVKKLGLNESIVLDGKGKNISTGGILFEAMEKYRLGSHLQINLELNHNKPILLLGTVLRCEPIANNKYDIAVSFSFGKMEKLASREIAKLVIKCSGVITEQV
ncbi:diguanylate cyclase [Colwelliaceae bacterium 6471]